MGENFIIFGANMSSSAHFDNKNNDILILGEGSIQELDDTPLTSEAKYPINFTQLGKIFVLSLHNNKSTKIKILLMLKIYQFKAKDSEIKHYTLCAGNISKDFAINNMKKRINRKCVFFIYFLNLCVFNKITGINQSKFLTKDMSCECKCRLDERKCNSDQWWKNDKCGCECKSIMYVKKNIFGILIAVLKMENIYQLLWIIQRLRVIKL